MRSRFPSAAFKIIGGLGVVVVSFAITLRVLDYWESGSTALPGAPALPGTETLQTVRAQNDAVAPIGQELPADPAKAKNSQGVSFKGMTFVPKDGQSTVRIQVTVFASAAEPNVAVVAVFRDGQEPPVRLVTKPVSSNRREKIDFSIDLPANGTNPMALDFRIGPGQPGTVVFNGPQGMEPVESTITAIERK